MFLIISIKTCKIKNKFIKPWNKLVFQVEQGPCGKHLIEVHDCTNSEVKVKVVKGPRHQDSNSDWIPVSQNAKQAINGHNKSKLRTRSQSTGNFLDFSF